MLESARASMGMSKAELARRGGLPPETVRRLLTSNEANPHFSMVADLLKPAGLGLFVGKLDAPAESAPAGPDRVQAWLAHLGAPLYGSTTVDLVDVPRPERVLAEALPLARRDAAVARALPVAVYRMRKRLDFGLLRRMARQRGQGRTLGFFLELSAELSGDRALAREARPLAAEARHRKRASQFFKLGSATERRLAELKTPPTARRWGFRMNMSADSFASMFRKAAR
ncbi:MAG: helix-turn-helix domain-containing protein [Polyangia bacterium]